MFRQVVARACELAQLPVPPRLSRLTHGLTAHVRPQGVHRSAAAAPGRLPHVRRRGRSCCTSARHAASRIGSGTYFLRRATSTPRCRRWCSRSAPSRSRSPTPRPRRCCSSTTSSRRTSRASTSCCAMTRAFPTSSCAIDHRVPAPGLLPRRAQRRRALLRALPQRRRGARHAQPAAEAVPHPQLPRQLLRQPQPPVPAAPDRALLGAVRRPDQPARPTPRTSPRR